MKSKLVIVTIFFCAVIPVKLFAQPQMGSDYPTVDHANIAVFLIDFPDTKDSIRALYPSLEEIRKELFDSTRTIQKYLKTMSYGKFKLTGDVFGPFRHQDPITADNKYQSNGYLTINSIKIPDFQYSKYTHFAFISFNDYINWGGCAFGKSNINPTYVTINNSKFEMFDYFRMVIQVGYYERNKANFFINTFLEPHPFIVEVPYEQHPDGEFYFQNYTGITYFQRGFLHEFIHTLHVWNHANSKTNSNRYTFEPEVPNNYDIYTNQDFLNIEYGNGFDMMGTANFSFSLNGGIRDLLGWTDNTNRVKLDTYSKQRIRLYPINRKEGYRICEIRLPDKYYSRDITKDVLDFPENGRKNRGYFLEVREVDKWDSTLIHPSINANTSGIILLETDGWTTYLLDASPSLNLDRNYLPDPGFCPDMRDVVLKPGMIYKNSEVYFSNVEKHNDGSYSVDIEIFDPSDPERLVPVARAGAGQTVNEGSVVSLDGSASSDPDGNTLTYKWTAPAGITLSSTTGAKPIFTAPEVTANTNYTLSLVVNDGTVDSPVDQVVITIKNVNKVPVANAGMDQSVNEGSTVSLDGSASSDPDGNPLTYNWTAPAGILLSSTTTAKPTFTTPEVTENTNYTFSLVVDDGTVDSPADQVVITVKNVNKAPAANAGPDQSVNEGSTVSLDGSASSDPDGNTLTYKWTASAGITLNSETTQKPTFIAPEVVADKTFTFSLVVNDGTIDSPVDQVVITVKNVNKSPVANAGVDQSVNEGATVSLDGSASSDPDGNTLTYKWTASAGIILNSETTQKPTFIAPEVVADKTFTFSLVVNDGTVYSPVDQVVITIKNVNKVPVANAGIDQFVNEGTTVFLDGTASSDPDGNTLTYKWTAPAGITLSSTTIAKPTFTAPEITINTNYTFSLVVNDGTVYSPVDQVVITVKNVNKVPVANAGADQSINEGSTINLDGSASSDPDGNTLTYKWTAPAGITLSSTTGAKPTLTAPEVTANTNYTFSLVVNDGTVDSPVDQVLITVQNVNKAPVANAGIDQSVNESVTVTLDGSSSSDPDGSTITYKWTAPAGITLNSTISAKPTFTAPEVSANTNYTFSLVVNDGTVDSPVDQVVITVKNVNKPPFANAGADQSVNEGATVSLDGSASSDPDGNPLTYKWTAPAGITLSSTTAAKPTFTAPEVKKDSTLSFSLVVNDGFVNSLPATVKVTVLNVIKVGVSAIESALLKVYPNPTKGIIQIEFYDIPQSGTWIIVYDISGKTVFKMAVKNKIETLNLLNHPAGLYLIRIDQKLPKTFKIILK